MKTLVIEVKVVPNSGRVHALLENGKIKLFIKSSPEKGKANAEVIKFFSKGLDLPHYSLAIISGMTTRNKLIKIATSLSYEELLQKMGINNANLSLDSQE